MIEFTDYGTVFLPNNKELSKKSFYNYLEKKIKQNKITHFDFNREEEYFIYWEEYEKYKIPITDNNKRDIDILLTLSELEHTIRKAKEDKEEELRQKHDLIRQAKKGKIVSEEAKELYLQELYKSITPIKFLRKTNIFKTSLSSSRDNDNFFLFTIEIIIGILSICPISFLIMALSKAKILALILMLLGFAFIIMPIMDISPLKLIYHFIKLSIKNIIEYINEIKITLLKIKHLKNVNIENIAHTKENIDNQEELINEYLEKYLNRIYLKINKLNKSDKLATLKLLEEHLSAYRTAISNLTDTKKTNAMIETSKFMLFLGELEQKIDAQISENNVETIKPIIQDETVSQPKKKLRTLGGK